MAMTRRSALGLGVQLLAAACHRGEGTSAPVDTPTPSPDRNLPIDEVAALSAYARLYGHVRWFHATDAAATLDWRKFTAQGAAYVAQARTLGELADALGELFGPIAPELMLWVDPEPAPQRPRPPRASEGLVYWQYQGYPGSIISLHKPPYYKVRVTHEVGGRPRFAPPPPPEAMIGGQLLEGLHAQLPLVLSKERAAAAEEQAAVAGLDFEIGARAVSSDGWESRPVRIGAIVEIWNVLRHFYPYQQEVEVPWDDALTQGLRGARRAETLEAMVDTVRELVAQLQDGHGFAGHPRLPHQRALPFRMEVVQGKPVITATEEPARFPVGAVVESIGKESALTKVQTLAARVSGSSHWRTFRAAAWEATAGPAHARVPVRLSDAAGERTIHSAYERSEPLIPARPEPVSTFEDGVFYIDLTRATWADIKARLAEISVAPGVVFDMRGYPNETHRILDHLMDAPEDTEWMHVPRYLAPGGEAVSWFPIGWHLRPSQPRVYGHRAFLVSPAAISYSESVLSYVEAHALGTIVGEAPSAGANGDIVRVDSLAGLFVIFTGMRVTRHDGRRFHVQGVAPQVRVQRTVEGLRAGRDEVLDEALALVRRKIETSPVEIPEPVPPPPEGEPAADASDAAS